ncbi:MAG TPA: gluconate 2-dehydrogenase subunit 3 family protein [Ohtaekwangia sp.]|nr:gluconate 2-dehydrogenase subunit 3 family protein [Ohtaekwangia sp.]
MDRRHVLKTIIAASGALVALPSWASSWTVSGIAGHQTSFAATGQELLASVVDTIIPAGNSIGALSVGVDKFLQKLFDNCYAQDVRDNIKQQLQRLEDLAQLHYRKPFVACDQLQRQELLLTFSGSEKKAEKDFFELVKSETIRGFNTSREVMVTYHGYKVVPGHYHGCVDVKI